MSWWATFLQGMFCGGVLTVVVLLASLSYQLRKTKRDWRG